MPATDTPTNPVVRTTPLRAYPGWVVRQYADGTFDSCQVSGGIALSPGYDTFADAVGFARNGGEVDAPGPKAGDTLWTDKGKVTITGLAGLDAERRPLHAQVEDSQGRKVWTHLSELLAGRVPELPR